MERFPTEIMVQIASCLPKPDLSRLGTCSSKCATIAQPQLYHTITLLDEDDSSERCSQFLSNVASRRHLPSMIRVLSIEGEDDWPELSLAALLKLCDHIEELLLPFGPSGRYPCNNPTLFFGMPVARLRRFHCRQHTAMPALVKWVTRIPTLTDIRLPERPYLRIAGVWGDTDVPQTWLEDLERYWGPPELLGSLTSGRKLLHFSTQSEISESQLQQLSTICGPQLQTLHDVSEGTLYRWETDPKFPPTLLSQLFPNLQSVAWILINAYDHDEVRTAFHAHPVPLIAL